MAIINDEMLQDFLTGGAGTLCPQDDKIVKAMLPVAVGAVANFLGWNPAQATADEFYPPEMSLVRGKFGIDIGSGTASSGGFPPFSREGQDRTLLLKKRPVRSITQIWDNEAAWDTGVDGGEWPTENILPTNTYWLDSDQSGICWSGKLYRGVGWARVRPRTVRVQYVYGFEADELLASYPTIHMALIMTAAFWAAKAKSASATFKANGAAAGRLPASISVLDFSVSYANSAANQFGMSSGGAGGGVGGGIPDDVIPLLLPHVSLAARFLT